MAYRYLLFDQDRTLLDFNASMRKAIVKLLLKYGFLLSETDPVKEEMIAFYDALNNSLWKQFEEGRITKNELVHTRFPVLCSRYGKTYPGKEKMETDYFIYLSEGHDVCDHAKETLHALSGRYEMYIITNGFIEVQSRRIKESGLAEYIKDVFISEQIGFRKPSVSYFEEVYQRIGRPPKEEILIVGDSMEADIKGGADFGIDTVLVSPVSPSGYDFAPSFVISSLKELPDLLGSINQ